MRAIGLARRLCALALCLLAGAPAAADGHSVPAIPSPLTPEEWRGKQLYFTGRSPSGKPILAWFGEDLIEVPGETVTCGSCHGYDGTGRPESGVIPTNVTWKYLTKAYGHVHPGGLEHPPFDEESLKEYMHTGAYPGGRQGDPSMPVYEMPARDLEDLIAFMKRLGELLDPGLTDTTITVGTLVPGEGPGAPAGTAVRGILEAYFGSVNEDGGIYGRRVQLVARTLPPDPAAALALAREWLEAQPAFALVSPFAPGLDPAVQEAASKEGVPVVGPLGLFAVGDFHLRKNVFQVLPGLAEQLRGLLYHLRTAQGLENPRTAILHADSPELGRLVGELAWALQGRDWTAVEAVALRPGSPTAAEVVERLQREGTEVVLLVAGESETRAWLQAAKARGWTPWVLVPGVLAGSLAVDAPKEFAGRLYLSYPSLAQDREEKALRELARLATLQGLPATHVQSMVSAYVSARVLVEGLRRAGKELSRRRLVETLEGVSEFETGLTRRLTYGPNRRVGALGAYVVPFATGAAGGPSVGAPTWVEVD